MRHASVIPAIPFLVVLLVSGQGAARSQDEVTWRDAMDREVVLALPVEDIVSLAPSATEILFAIGAGELVAGVSKHCDYPLEAKLKPRAGDFNSPDLEALRAAKPQVVLFTEYARADDLDALEKEGIATLVLQAGTVGEIVLSVRLLGRLTGKEEAAEELASSMEGELETLRLRTAEIPREKRPRVYVEVDGPQRLYAVGPGSFMDDVVTLAGGENVFAAKESPYFAVEPEEVIRLDPEVIFIDYPFQYKVGVGKRPGWEAVDAVRKGRVYDGTDFDYILLNRPGPRIVESMKEIARLLHPGVFDDR